MGVSYPPPNLKNVEQFCRAKMVVKCTSVGQFTGQRTIGDLLLLKKTRRKEPVFIRTLRLKLHCLTLLNKNPKET